MKNNKMRFERFHGHHYFGGMALIMLLAQLLTGIFLTLFYQPNLAEAYASVQYLYKGFAAASWVRDSHRWIAFFIFFAITIHTVRSLLRKDFMNFEKRSRTIWLTGGLMLAPMGALLVTGFILPWEWKGYWFMEMVPNYLENLPIVGPTIKQFLIDAFSINRNFMAHIIILPVIALVLLDLHVFSKVRRRKGGIPGYLVKHGILVIPFIILVVVLAFYIPMPTEDPDIIPMPLEGEFIPVAESFFLIFLVPFMYFSANQAMALGLFLPFVIYLVLTFLPYLIKPTGQKLVKHEPGGDVFFKEFRHLMGNILKITFMRKMVAFMTVVVAAGAVFGFIYLATYKSPTLGCNSCHNVAMGSGIGVPPKHFKDRSKEPKLDNSSWMVKHWFYPQLAW